MTDSESAIPADVRLKDGKPATPTLTTAELAAFLEVDEDRAAQILEVASTMVTQYAPSAPAAMQNEAVRRFAGYLEQRPAGSTVQSKDVGPVSVTYDPISAHGPAFRNSGAAMLLTRWRRRRAGAI